MKIFVSVFNNLLTDQRVEKVCRTLHENGYEIHLIGNNWEGLPEIVRPYEVHRIVLRSKTLKLAYPEFNFKLYKFLQKNVSPGCILLANDLDTLAANYALAKQKNIPLLFDSHEIFTEQPSVQGRRVKKIWQILERKMLPHLRFMMTESESYAEWFRRKYGIAPVVIRNVPKRIQETPVIPENNPKIVLYQGALNGFRGLKQAISAMKLVENAELWIAGDGPNRSEYEQHCAAEDLQHKIKFLGKLKPADLRKITARADVGIAVEENGGISYLLSLPNKVPDYIQSRVPAVMINFPEMLKIYEKYLVGEIITNHAPQTIADAIQKILKNGRQSYLPELEKAAAELNWEQQESKLLDLVKHVADSRSRR